MANVTVSGEKETIVAACSAGIASSLGAASLLAVGRKWRHCTWVKCTHGREQYGECNTLLLELAATEVVKCVQYLRVDIEPFEELLSMVAPLIQWKSTRFG